jgi:hypothetical protein
MAGEICYTNGVIRVRIFVSEKMGGGGRKMLEEKNLRTFRVIFLFLFTATICLASTERAAFAAEIVDQSNLPEWAGGWTHINPDPNGQAGMWQTFTPEFSNITAVEIDILTITAGRGDDTLTVEIAKDKDGEILASAERYVEDGFDGLLRFEFAEAIGVVPGELYELKVHDTGLTRFGWKYASNTYDAGSRYVFADERPGTDWLFRTYSNVEPRIIYVDDDAAGANNGTSWKNAYVYLQYALAYANLVEKPIEIRIAQGIYRPNQGLAAIPEFDWGTTTFHLINGVALKGGYAGLGTPDPNARDIELYETILSGDLLQDDIEVSDPCDLLNAPNRADNSWNVVTGSNTDATTVLDGFTITGGYVSVIPFGGSPAGGAGMIISSGSPTIINCTFTDNITGNTGGGLLIYDESNPTLLNCKFIRNCAESGGGGIFSSESSPTLINCKFINNYARRKGGAIFNFRSNPELTDCTFSGNSIPDIPTSLNEGGGAIRNSDSNLLLNNCAFSDNKASYGAGMHNENNSNPILKNCTFRNNSARISGGGMFTEDSNDLRLIDCIFSGNSALSGGGMSNKYSNMVIVNCIFSGNKAFDELRTDPPEILPGEGGGLYTFGNIKLINCTNCTFTGNLAQKGRAIAKSGTSDFMLTNCILWNGGNEIFDIIPNRITFDISYSNIQNVVEGKCNINEDPLFANPGYWADADDPNIIADPNDPNAVWIDGDYRLKSQAGRWDPASESWVQDDVTSPSIDAGDPNSPIGHEPFPNGGIINMGAYGGTAEASKSITSELFQTSQELIRAYGFKYGK